MTAATASLEQLQPGGLLHYDYRTSAAKASKLPDTLRVVQWNIERGMQLDAITPTLAACNADLIVLQELDIHCHRSAYVNQAEALAKALEMELYFVCEFEELDTPARAEAHRVGPPSVSESTAKDLAAVPAALRPLVSNGALRHFHGNAILSRRATLRDPTVLRHRVAGFNWNEKAHAGAAIGEPRRGFRSLLRVRIDPADRTSPETMGPLYVYCAHFEVFCGGLTRLRQLGDAMADARRLLQAACDAPAKEGARRSDRVLPAFLLAGDLNTMGHSIVRLSPAYCTDRLRLLSLGESEACWLQRKVLSRRMYTLTRGCCPVAPRFIGYSSAIIHQWIGSNDHVWRWVYGLTAQELADVANTDLCFYDPGDKATSITLDNPRYRGWVRGKLDWLLLSNLCPRPFRTAAGGAAPVDVAALEALGVLRDPEAARALRGLPNQQQQQQEGVEADLAREASVAVAARHTPAEGYVRLNTDYTASDHCALVMTVQQRSAAPLFAYPEYGATYTSSLVAVGALVLTRVVPLALAGYAIRRWLQAL